ncbi:Carnitine transport permease protein OpuCB [Thalassovita gelatinovora]|uniref:Carnitine transport permease protein OpuCB n=1 Tax=Thalassovita gelatinovora TaxID=53501 RepID=A0A0P1F6S2_THAGE|nr:ABC transporter permease subunit [Thalassovita gelatinovora]QIZ79181.1 ABC transporter permease subunit [Thalassovita gelatinovora]CUH63653.1 Carnitine transport permease protein OpuCB [Thalassovita gelatinovora]SER00997.1 NitT/TauT family transport system permease protein [Thalassovita gelatinovora]
MSEIAKKAKVEVYPPQPVPTPPTLTKRLILNLMPPVILGIGVIIAYALVRNSLPPHRQFLMPSAGGLWELALGLPDFRRELLARTGVTIGIALTGLAVTIPTAIAVGIIMFRFYTLEKAIFPFLVALQSVPVMAIIPLIQSALGFGLAPKVLIVVLFTFFAIPTTLLLGLKSVDKNILNLFRLQGASWWVMLRKACFPSAAPTLFAGLKISGSLAVIAAIVSELFFLSGEGGLGQLLMNSKIDFKYEQMYAALIASSILSISVYLLFNWLGNRLFSHWHESSEK